MKVTDKITITNEDNMALMARYPDNYFDLAIVDPPYGIGEDGAKNHSRGKATRPTMYTAKDWDSSAPSAEYFKELNRVCKNVVIWGANHFIQNISDAGINTNSSCWIVWDKDNTGDFADCELAWSNYKGAVRKFKWRWNGMLQEDMSNKETRIHPTQKPVALYKWILDKYAKPNDKILDTHLGSGSIAIACHDYGFDLTACELDQEYYDKAIQRIKNHTAQTKLF
jgi:site-specific DNA-methyltransferase (adenine-specific)